VIVSRDEFEKQRAAGGLYIALIGMSSVGKSHRANELVRKLKWQCWSVDEKIAARIAASLPVADVHGLAEWMQTPDTAGYAERETTYLDLENDETRAAVPNATDNFVLDTTGSSVYLPDETLDELRSRYLIVHLSANKEKLTQMVKRYFETPKPVVWGPAYEPRNDENAADSLRRCYPQLLDWRMKKYNELADVTISGWNGKHEKHSPDAFLDMIRDKLAA